MAIKIIKFIHILLSFSFLGLQVACFYYVATSLRDNNLRLIRYTLENTLMIDLFSGLAIMTSLFTCLFLVMHLPHFSFQTPWIQAACLLLSIITLCWITNIAIKHYNLKHIKQHTFVHCQYKRLLYVSYSVIIVLLLLTIRDAVMRSTLLPGVL